MGGGGVGEIRKEKNPQRRTIEEEKKKGVVPRESFVFDT
jgi:hypothetical protein